MNDKRMGMLKWKQSVTDGVPLDGTSKALGGTSKALWVARPWH